MFTKSLTLALLAAVAVNGARVRRDDGYGAPEPDTYGAPAESYGAPVESYGVSAPSYGAAETGLDLTTIIIPLLALLGLFLLFPTYVTLTNVRRKREALDTETEVSAVERMMDMYQVNIVAIIEFLFVRSDLVFHPNKLVIMIVCRLSSSPRSVWSVLPVTWVAWPPRPALTPASPTSAP